MIPLAAQWATDQEALILTQGVPLTTEQLADAQRVGVLHPEKVRILKVAIIPGPTHPLLASAAKSVNLTGPNTLGLTLGYGIYIRADQGDSRPLVVHELAHTAQFERLGGINAFLRQYLKECLKDGYNNAPLELEARNRALEIAG